MLGRISLPIQLVLVILFSLMFGSFFSPYAISVLYTFSTIFKEILVFALPFIVFSFVSSGILSFKKSAPVILLVLIMLVFVSNGIAALTAYGVINLFYSVIACTAPTDPVIVQASIQPLFIFSLPRLLPSEYALLLAIVFGLIFSFFEWPAYERGIEQAKRIIEFILKQILIPLLPLYVLGFLLKIQYEGLFAQLAQQYGSAFALIIGVQICYLFVMYLVANGFSLSGAIQSIKNIVPSYLTAFSTMSSTATVPVAVVNAEKNTGNRALAAMSIPIMANIHMVGDSLSTPILAMVTMMIFKGCLPSLVSYIVFVGYFCMAMLAASGIPGGGIFVVIPALTHHFGFSPDMISVITMLYFLLDSFGTAANIAADGGLVIILNNVLKRLRIIQ